MSSDISEKATCLTCFVLFANLVDLIADDGDDDDGDCMLGVLCCVCRDRFDELENYELVFSLQLAMFVRQMTVSTECSKFKGHSSLKS